MSISVENVSFKYTSAEVLRGVSFDADGGELLAVLGPNGVGKTTLFRCILGLEKTYSGKILIDGEATGNMDAGKLAERVAYIPQIRQQVFGFSVLDMVLMGTNHKISGIGVPGKKEKETAKEALYQMGIADLADKDYSRISGGEQQLVLIARALAQRSKNLLMDEPTSALDYGNQARVLNEVRKLADMGYCVVLSTHNPQQAIWYADKALALSEGKVIRCEDPEKMMTEELVEKLYGIKVSVMNTGQGRFIFPHINRNEMRAEKQV